MIRYLSSEGIAWKKSWFRAVSYIWLYELAPLLMVRVTWANFTKKKKKVELSRLIKTSNIAAKMTMQSLSDSLTPQLSDSELWDM